MIAGDALVLQLTNLSKRFGGVQALSDVNLTIMQGEVHGLVGENGSGKSTLVKTLAGYHVPDGGSLTICGAPVRLPLHPGQFRSLGMSFVHQEKGLIPSLSVAENFMIGELAGSRRRRALGRWSIAWTRERRRVADMLARYNLDVDPRAIVSKLSSVERAMLAIVRAVEELALTSSSLPSRLLILDEPSAYLPAADVQRLHALVRDIAARGSSVLLVSHDLEEIMAVTDQVTVLRDGRAVGCVRTAQLTQTQLVEMIVGRRLALTTGGVRKVSESSRVPAIVGRHISGGALSDVSFEVFDSEVLGITGLSGSGFTDLCYVLFGALPEASGTVTIDSRLYEISQLSPARALKMGIVLLPGERQRQGAIDSLPVVENVTMAVLASYFRHLMIRKQEMLTDVVQINDRFDVRPNDPRRTYSTLSGGNQQKALLGKWLQGRPKLALLHEPTVGVDVGARRTIFEIIRNSVRSGAHVICASGDYGELAEVCDRVLILKRGRVASELRGTLVTKQAISIGVLSDENGNERETSVVG